MSQAPDFPPNPERSAVRDRRPRALELIRFILDGANAYTTVEGERTYMSPGDFILTPNWLSHDHGNMTDEPMLWLDVLDVPMINYFETTFCENFDRPTQQVAHQDGDSLAFFGSGVLPEGTPGLKSSPIINYSYAHTRPILERLRAADRVDPRHGARVRYANPVNGGWTMPTMGAHLALLPAGFTGMDYRATDGTIFVCVETWSGAAATFSSRRRGCGMLM